MNSSDNSSSASVEAWLDKPKQTPAYSRQSEALLDLQALRQAAHLGEQRKLRDGSIRKEVITPTPKLLGLGGYATPLSPLRERDHKALVQFFQREDMPAVEADFTQMLLRLLPEPCWEDDPFEFLREFL